MTRLIPAVLAFALLAAHFFRAGQTPLVAVCLLLAAGAFVRHRAMPRVLQVALVLGAAEWLRTLVVFASARMAVGAPWTRLALILGGVAAFTLLAGVLLQTRAARRRFEPASA